MSKKSIIFAISSLILLQIAIGFIQYSEKNRGSEMQIVDYFQKSLFRKAELSKRLINDRSVKSIDLLNKEDITVLEYKNDSIVYWSNNSVCISGNTKEIISTKSFARIGNAWYLINAKGSSFALCLVKRDFPSPNKHLRNEFGRKLGRFPNIRFSDDIHEFKHVISDSSGKNIMSIDTSSCSVRYSNWTLILFSIQLLILLAIGIYNISLSKNKYDIFFLAVFLTLIRVLIVDSSIYLEILNKPFINISISGNYLLSHFIVDTVLGSALLITLSNKKRLLLKSNILINILVFGIAGIYAAVAFYISCLTDIINNTDISLSLSRWDSVNTSSYLVYITLALGFYSICIATRRLILDPYKESRLRRTLPVCVVITSLFGVFGKNLSENSFYISLLVFIILFFNIILLKVRRQELIKIIFIIQLFAISTCLVYFIHDSSVKQLIEKEKQFAKTISIEKDSETERILVKLSSDIDSIILSSDSDINDKIYKACDLTLGSKYYTGITECESGDIISLGNDKEFSCFEFFEKKRAKTINIDGSKFQLEDVFDGKISYIGRFIKKRRRFYVELSSKARNEGSGYPELLDGLSLNNPNMFSWAKYSNKKLLTSSGKYNFQNILPRQINVIEFKDASIVYNHTIKDNNILVAADSKLAPNKVLNIPYLFIILCMITFTPWVFKSLKLKKNSFRSFNSKIRNRFIFSTIIFFLMIGSASTYYNIVRFEDRQEERISQLLKTLTRRLETIEINSNSLGNISDILQTDINIFNSQGFLLHTSRPEVYDKFIASELMNPIVLRKIKNKSIIFKNESITDMDYISVYAPLSNSLHSESLFINIPYFSESAQLSEEVSNLLIGGLNIFILISLIAIVIAIYLADKITKPLNIIYSRFREMELTKENRPIDYSENNELGRLVKEYNSTVSKLSISAEKLAKSQRETAWREMAKQIAHEIKNPLTPMKLSIQHLQFTKDLSSEKWDNQFKKTCKILLEQIDNLSNIASSFSDFSNISKIKAERVNIPLLLEGIKDLFSEDDNIGLTYPDNKIDTIAPPNQLRRAFINIVKNALHSMENRESKRLDISIERDDKFLLIRFKDYGIGIPEDIKEKLFEPHFTTKSSGMGLGLAISREIIISSKGDIWFESEKEKGTTFFIKLPLYIEV